MNIRKILFIDDEDISSIESRIKRILAKNGITLESTIINVSHPDFRIRDPESGEQVINVQTLKKAIEKNYFDNNFDVIACDVDFKDTFNGYELLTWIYNNVHRLKKPLRKSAFVFYTSDDDVLRKKIAERDVLKVLQIKVERLIQRANLDSELAQLVNKINSKIDYIKEFQNILEPQKDKVFKSIYPKFRGLTLEQVLHEIEAGTHHGDRFQKALIKQCISHMVELQED